jgi:hypothetical protein
VVKAPAHGIFTHCLVQSAEEDAKAESEEDEGEGSLRMEG